MNYKQICDLVRMNSFPLDDIKDIEVNLDKHFAKIKLRTGDSSKADTYTKLKMLGINTISSAHYEDKSKHDCTQTTWTTKVEGWPVDYVYKFCAKCKTEIDKKAVVFNNDENTCRIIDF